MPSAGRPQPNPPTPEQAARPLNLVFTEDEEFGLYLWTSFTAGGRRGEMVGLRENRFNFDLLHVWFAKNYLVKGGKRIEKAPKDGEGRFVSLDPLTCELNRDYFGRRRAAMAQIGVQVPFRWADKAPSGRMGVSRSVLSHGPVPQGSGVFPTYMVLSGMRVMGGYFRRRCPGCVAESPAALQTAEGVRGAPVST